MNMRSMIDRGIASAKFLALMIPLLVVGGKAFGANALDIRSANFAAKVDCLAGDPAIQDNDDLCVFYGKVISLSSTEIPSLGFSVTFQPYNEAGVAQTNQPIRVGADAGGELSLGSGRWYSGRLAMTRTLLTNAINSGKSGSVVVKKNRTDGKFYLQASSAKSTLMPWGDTDAVSNEIALFRCDTVTYPDMRSVSAYHVYHNADKQKQVDWNSISITKMEHIRQKIYATAGFGGYIWVTQYVTETSLPDGSITTGSPTGTMPSTYLNTADDTKTTSELNGSTTTSSNPYYSTGLIVITMSNGEVYHIGSRRFTGDQLSGIVYPDSVFLPCPFCSYALSECKKLIQTAMNPGNRWKFVFNFVDGSSVYSMVNGTMTYLGNFTGKKWIIGRPIARTAEFLSNRHHDRDENGNVLTDEGAYLIDEALEDYQKITELTGIGTDFNILTNMNAGGHIDYNTVNCACIELVLN